VRRSRKRRNGSEFVVNAKSAITIADFIGAGSIPAFFITAGDFALMCSIVGRAQKQLPLFPNHRAME
jgi:hypothetical protein